MADKVELGISIDTTDVKAATQALDELAAAAERAAVAMDKLQGRSRLRIQPFASGGLVGGSLA